MVTLSWRKNVVLVIATLAMLALMGSGMALAAGNPKATTISMDVPTNLTLGQRVSLRAVLADSAGHPIPKATIYFTSPASFLNVNGDIIVAQAVTNKSGQAIAEFESGVAGSITLHAEFRGIIKFCFLMD